MYVMSSLILVPAECRPSSIQNARSTVRLGSLPDARRRIAPSQKADPSPTRHGRDFSRRHTVAIRSRLLIKHLRYIRIAPRIEYAIVVLTLISHIYLRQRVSDWSVPSSGGDVSTICRRYKRPSICAWPRHSERSQLRCVEYPCRPGRHISRFRELPKEDYPRFLDHRSLLQQWQHSILGDLEPGSKKCGQSSDSHEILNIEYSGLAQIEALYDFKLVSGSTYKAFTNRGSQILVLICLMVYWRKRTI
jgi:hypothetical protein